MANESLVVQPQGAVSFYDRISDPMAAIGQLGDYIWQSGMFGCTKKEQGHLLAFTCLTERKTPIEIMRKYHLIDGKLAMRAEAMLAEYRGRGGKVRWKQCDENGCVGDFTIDSQTTTISFMVADATRAGLLPGHPKSGWAKYPGDMMRARVIARAVRMLCPEAIVGCYTDDELQTTDTVAPVQRVSVAAAVAAPAAVAPKAAEVVKPANVVEVPKEEEKVAVKLAEVAPGVTGVVEVKNPAAPVEPMSKPAEVAEADNARSEKIDHIRKFYGDKKLTIDRNQVPMIVNGEAGPEFTAWLVASQWLKEGQKLSDLSDAHCERILARMDALPRAIESKKLSKA